MVRQKHINGSPKTYKWFAKNIEIKKYIEMDMDMDVYMEMDTGLGL